MNTSVWWFSVWTALLIYGAYHLHRFLDSTPLTLRSPEQPVKSAYQSSTGPNDKAEYENLWLLVVRQKLPNVEFRRLATEDLGHHITTYSQVYDPLKIHARQAIIQLAEQSVRYLEPQDPRVVFYKVPQKGVMNHHLLSWSTSLVSKE